jgi:hypothetical protein
MKAVGIVRVRRQKVLHSLPVVAELKSGLQLVVGAVEETGFKKPIHPSSRRSSTVDRAYGALSECG